MCTIFYFKKNLFNHQFHKKGFQTLLTDQLDQSKATCSFGKSLGMSKTSLHSFFDPTANINDLMMLVSPNGITSLGQSYCSLLHNKYINLKGNRLGKF